MSDIRIPGAAVEAALTAYVNAWDHSVSQSESCVTMWADDEIRNARAGVRAAIAAALPEILEEVKYEFRDKLMDYDWGPWFTFNSERARDLAFDRMQAADGWQAEKRNLYRIKDQT
jgi:hypothetical protein